MSCSYVLKLSLFSQLVIDESYTASVDKFQEANMSENLCLKWTSFQENVKHAFGNIRQDKDFTDVALACEDGEQVEAHRVILAASSPFFQNILKNNKQSPQLLIYMRGVKSEDLLAIIDFLYVGEATIRKENLDDFLAVAAELKIAGLMKQAVEKDVVNLKEAPQVSEDPEEKETADRTIRSDYSEPREVKTEEKILPQNHFSGNIEELDETVKSMMVKSTNFVPNRKVRAYADICKACGKEGLGSVIKQHIEVSYFDNICNHSNNIKNHLDKIKNHLDNINNHLDKIKNCLDNTNNHLDNIKTI